VFLLDDSAGVRYANEAGLRMLAADAAGPELRFDRHVVSGSRATFRRYLATVRRRGSGGELEVALTGAGRETVVQLAGSLVEDESGELVAVIVAADVTERHAVDRIKSDFLAMVSHELRTPLTAISGFAQLLQQREHQKRASVQHMAERIEERASHLTGLIENLLHVLQSEARSFGTERRRTDVKALVDVCLETAVPSPAHRLEAVAPPRPRSVLCDQFGLQQAIGNLIDNAIKFSPDGGTVTVRIEQPEGRTRISVQDEGVGVSPEARDVIFERFAQADMSSTREFGGFGLGLFLVKQVAEAHAGSVTVEDAEPRGSVFTLEIAETA
jgi:signal transduction histidine kinase